MPTATKFASPASATDIVATAKALNANGFDVTIVENLDQARQAALDRIPTGAEVFAMTSVTLEEAGITAAINKSGKYKSIRKQLVSMDRATQAKDMTRLGAAPDIAVGSVHAVTADGHVLIASNTGSQLSAYASTASKVIWVVGSQKLVRDIPEGTERIYQHSLPLESIRAARAYGATSSNVRKILIVNNERPNRIHIIIVSQAVGY